MNTISAFRICWYNLRGFAKNDTKLQMEKLEVARRYHNIVDMLDTHLIKDEVDIMVKNNKTFFQNFLDPILIPSKTGGIMVLLRKACGVPVQISHKEITPNYLAVR